MERSTPSPARAAAADHFIQPAATYADARRQRLTSFSSTALTDARFYGLDFGVPAFCFGATMEGAHGFNERVDLASVKRVTKALALFTASWCGIEPA
ncbi:M20/M25/M40 family metallo-hydrolase [Rhodopseudomonas palustris]|uniref:M20/M25/M40 family metallo-hydrolase n=1 Tax=Rhodopseudomonas palustris TaxID=1076 RepID=UPI0039B6EAA9